MTDQNGKYVFPKCPQCNDLFKFDGKTLYCDDCEIQTKMPMKDMEELIQIWCLAITAAQVEDHLYTEVSEAVDDSVDDIHDYYTEDEIDQMARDVVDIYDNDNGRAECWLYAFHAGIENGIKQMRPYGRKLATPFSGSPSEATSEISST